jgi:hypothetical protein
MKIFLPLTMDNEKLYRGRLCRLLTMTIRISLFEPMNRYFRNALVRILSLKIMKTSLSVSSVPAFRLVCVM